MTPAQNAAAVAIRSIVCLLAFWAALQFMVWPSLITQFRQRLFEIRHGLFLLMADGRLLPTDEIYVHLRSTLNGLIRAADRMTFFRLVLGTVLMKHEGEEYRCRLTAMLEIHPPEVQQELGVLWSQMDREILLHMARASPAAWLAMIVVVICKFFSRGINFTARLRKSIVQVMEAQADAESCDADRFA